MTDWHRKLALDFAHSAEKRLLSILTDGEVVHEEYAFAIVVAKHSLTSSWKVVGDNSVWSHFKPAYGLPRLSDLGTVNCRWKKKRGFINKLFYCTGFSCKEFTAFCLAQSTSTSLHVDIVDRGICGVMRSLGVYYIKNRAQVSVRGAEIFHFKTPHY